MTIDITRGGVWMRVDPPTERTPFWSDHEDGRLLTIQMLYIEDPDRRPALAQAHADAVRDLLLAAFAAKAKDDHARARELFTRAGRLCTDPLGHFPPEPA